MSKFYAFFILLGFIPFAWGQEHRSLQAKRVSSPPRIDAMLNDSCWIGVEAAKDFTQYELQPGEPSVRNSLVKIVYDDEAIYIGAELEDTSADSVLRELSTRDNEANADLFGILFDTYNDDINAFGFFVTAAGTQIDARYSTQGQDFDWNAVWTSAVHVHKKGWNVELRIPYSALRFSKKEVQTWGINILRKIRRLREMSFWNFTDPKIDALVRQFGDLEGLEKIKPPLRLSFSPYVAGIVEHYPYHTLGVKDLTYHMSGGMDLKYGLSDGFTLDMTLVPDFSQVQSDNQVLNLSPFEVQFQERRPFFTEGTELFNKGGLFYSRRVGGLPIDYYNVQSSLRTGERIVKNPSQTQLLNATKLSGRTPQKLGIGVFNAVSNETHALIEDSTGAIRRFLTGPLTNYNIVVLDQAMKNNSSLSFINTNVTREGHYGDANVAGSVLQINNKKNTYFLSTNNAISSRLNPGIKPDNGYRSSVELGKNGGNFRYSLFNNVRSDRFNPNDLGLLQLGNNIETGLWLGYFIFKPVWKINSMYNNMTILYQRMFNPNAFWNFGIYSDHVATFTKRFLTCGINYGIEPVITYDYYEPRVFGRFYTFPINYNGGGFISSDYRKPFALDISANYRWFKENARSTADLFFSPRYRASNRLSFIYEISQNLRNDDIGFVNLEPDSGYITFGRRDLETVSNIFSSIYKFTNKMSLSFRLRHYWSKAVYRQYYRLGDDGSLNYSNYGNSHDVNFNAFNIDMVFFWQFAPGSELNVVWKNAVLKRETDITSDYYTNFRGTFDSPQNNTLSIKVLYYFDYLMLRKLAKSKKRQRR